MRENFKLNDFYLKSKPRLVFSQDNRMALLLRLQLKNENKRSDGQSEHKGLDTDSWHVNLTFMPLSGFPIVDIIGYRSFMNEIWTANKKKFDKLTILDAFFLKQPLNWDNYESVEHDSKFFVLVVTEIASDFKVKLMFDTFEVVGEKAEKINYRVDLRRIIPETQCVLMRQYDEYSMKMVGPEGDITILRYS